VNRPSGAPTRDEGVSLIEVVAASAMMMIVVVPLGNAVLTSVQASSRSVENAKVITIAQNAADRVNRAGKSCDYAQYARAAATNEGWPASSVTVVQEHFVAASLPTQPGVWQNEACADGVLGPMLVQRVRITVTGGEHGLSSTIDVVKSDV
jgi:Tfp pilus assembly protein PilV